MIREAGQQSLALFAINIDDDNPAWRAGRDSYVRVGPLHPPLTNLPFVARGVLETVFGERLFSSRFAWKDCEAGGRQVERGLSEL
jgi:hypothetical protein